MATNGHKQAIVTKYLGPTDRRGSRVKATCAAGSLTLGWENELNTDENHAKAAQALADKFGWKGQLVGGGLPGGGCAFVFAS